jgi:hypothetical protein
LVLALGALLGVALLSPVSAHHTPKHTRKQIRAIRADLREVDEALDSRYTKGEADALFEADETVLTFIERRDMDDPTTVPLVQAGPFTITSRCEDDGNVHTALFLESSEPGAVYRRVPSTSGPVTSGTFLGGFDGAYSVPATNSAELGGHAVAPVGWAIDFRIAIATSVGGFDCTFSGWVIVTGRP